MILCHNDRIPRLIWYPIPILTILWQHMLLWVLLIKKQKNKKTTKTSIWSRVHWCFLEAIPLYGMPLTIESTSFATCCTIVVSQLKKKMLLLPTTRPEIPWSLQNGTLISRLTLITRLPVDLINKQQICAYWETVISGPEISSGWSNLYQGVW